MKKEYQGFYATTKKYVCDGPLCRDKLAVVQTPNDKVPMLSFCVVVVPNKDKPMFNPEQPCDITDYGWCRMIINNSLSHVCPKCQDYIIEESFVKLIQHLRDIFKGNLSNNTLTTLSKVFKRYFINIILNGYKY